MEHLSVETIIRFITFTEMNESNMKLSSKVNSHMVKCPECRKRVHSIMSIHDSLTVRRARSLPELASDELESELEGMYGKTN